MARDCLRKIISGKQVVRKFASGVRPEMFCCLFHDRVNQDTACKLVNLTTVHPGASKVIINSSVRFYENLRFCHKQRSVFFELQTVLFIYKKKELQREAYA